MRTIAIINQKGGCGKTTVSINLAATLAARGHRTLLVDMDPQSHCALGLAVPESQIERHIGDMLRAGLDGSMALADIVWQISRSLDLAPSTMALAGIEQELAVVGDRDRRLVQVLSTVADRYDYCIIDCPPSIGLLTFNALRAADEVLIPVETGYFALQGAVKQKATVEMLARRANHGVRFKVLATMYDVRTKLAREILSELKKQFGEHLLPIVVHFNSKLKEAVSFGQPIVEYDPASRGMQDFENLANWLLTNPPARRSPAPEVAAINDEQVAAPSAGRAVSMNPAMSRAAELVERARALSSRTAALAARLNRGPDAAEIAELTEEQDIAPAARRPGDPLAPQTQTQTQQADGARSARRQPPQQEQEHSPSDQQDLAVAVAEPQPRREHLARKLARMHGVCCTAQGVLFIQPADSASRIAVAGDFNGWSPNATPLKRDEALGVFQTCITVPPGRYRYRLIVDGRWIHDPYNNYVEANPYGELNSILEVNPS